MRAAHRTKEPKALLATAAFLTAAASLPGQNLFEHLGSPANRLAAGSLGGIASGDFNGDGLLDIASSEQGRIYSNSLPTPGRFVPGAPITRQHDSVAAGDLDGDGDLDLLFASYQFLTVALNDGSGGSWSLSTRAFPVGVPWPPQPQRRRVTLGDIDGDGDLDAAIAGEGFAAGNVANTLFINDGAGVFTEVTGTALRFVSPPDSSSAIALGDIDGDGDLDMVVATTGRNDFDPVRYVTFLRRDTNRLLLNDGTGVFQEQASAFPGSIGFSTDVTVGDVDDDGDLDVFFASGQWPYRDLLGIISPNATPSQLWINDGSGAFTLGRLNGTNWQTEAPERAQFVDVDGDGDLDVAGGCALVPSGTIAKVYINDGSGDLTQTDLSPTSNVDPGVGTLVQSIFRSSSLAVGDFDLDGDVDLVVDWASSPGWPILNRFTSVLTNLRQDLDVSPIQIGQTTTIDLYARSNTHTLGIVALAPNTATIPLPGVGTLGVDPTRAFLTWGLIPQPAGSGTLTVPIPANQSLVGQSVFIQALLLTNNGPGGLQGVLTRVVSDLVRL